MRNLTGVSECPIFYITKESDIISKGYLFQLMVKKNTDMAANPLIYDAIYSIMYIRSISSRSFPVNPRGFNLQQMTISWKNSEALTGKFMAFFQ